VASKELNWAGVSLAFSQVESIKILRRGRCVVLKLYYLRERVGKATHVKQRFDRSLIIAILPKVVKIGLKLNLAAQ